jgi:small subunit ribosomal protein S2
MAIMEDNKNSNVNVIDRNKALSYEDMIKAGMHFGRKKTVFNPNMKQYVHALKENIYIIDLIKTSKNLSDSISFMRQVIEDGGVILFVGTTSQSKNAVKEAAESLNMPYVINRWLGGTLTNFKIVISRVKYLENLEHERETGGFQKYTKKERLDKEREIESLRIKYDGLRTLTKLPNAVFVTSTKENQIAIKEAIKMKIKLIGIINTDSNPDQLDWPIPSNDNARKSVEFIMNAVKESLVDVRKNLLSKI